MMTPFQIAGRVGQTAREALGKESRETCDSFRLTVYDWLPSRHQLPLKAICLMVILSAAMACGYGQAARTAWVGSASPTPPPIPTDLPLTPTPTLTSAPSGTSTLTATQAPTATATPTVTLTVAKTPTALVTPAQYSVSAFTLTPSRTPTSGQSVTLIVPSNTPSPSPTPLSPVPPSPAPGFELGGQVPGFIGFGDQMHGARMTWAKFQVIWTPGMDPGTTDDAINDAHSHGLKALLSIKGPLYPSAIDYNGYVDFVRGAASRGADGIEIWNEMNLDREWPSGQINPSSYVDNMLKPAYKAIKSASPNTLVITGALAPTGVHDGVSVWSDDRYLAGMRDAGAADYMDCLGVHHNSGATSPNATAGHPADGGDHHYSWYYRSTYTLYADIFPKNKLCFTELGYLSPEGYGDLPPAFWWASGTGVSDQAQWLGRAVTLARSSGRVRLVIIFNVGFTTWTDDPQAGYSIIRPDGSCAACTALAGAVP